jgi:hypothetical protein
LLPLLDEAACGGNAGSMPVLDAVEPAEAERPMGRDVFELFDACEPA